MPSSRSRPPAPGKKRDPVLTAIVALEIAPAVAIPVLAADTGRFVPGVLFLPAIVLLIALVVGLDLLRRRVVRARLAAAGRAPIVVRVPPPPPPPPPIEEDVEYVYEYIEDFYEDDHADVHEDVRYEDRDRDLIPGAKPLPDWGRGRRARPAVAPAPPAAGWAGARDRFARLREEYAAFECDPLQVLRLPALADVAVPSTARFVDAFAEAQGLATDTRPGDGHAGLFVAAVGHAERTWEAAREAAGRIRLSGLTPAERATVERVIKLLTTARDSDSEPERLVAYSRARTELARLDAAGVVHVPLPAQGVLEAASRRELPP